MTKERACAINEVRRIKPVTAWENEEAKGHALCDDRIFREHIEKAETLRSRQAEYLATLPTDPREAIKAALKAMHPDAEQYPEGIEEALHLSIALEAMVKYGNVDDGGITQDATLYVAERVNDALHRVTRQLDRIADILGNPGRIERERNSSPQQ